MTASDTPSPLPKLAVIAREAGVSVATVSKALNGRSDVSQHTRRLVAEVLERRGYPRQRVRPTRGSMVDVMLQGLDSPYALAILGGVEDAAWRLGVDLIVSAVVDRTKNGQPPPAWLDRIGARDSAGVLLVRTSPTATQRAWLTDHGIPAVIVDPRRKPPPGVSIVAADNLDGAREATEHLIGLGHERIAIVTGRPGVPCAVERLNGYRQAMAAAGLAVDPRWEVCGYFQRESALTATRELLDTAGPHRPTAIFTCSDAMGVGVYQALGEHGLRVPDDVSVVGFDDSWAAAHVTPALTTVRQPWPELGSVALGALLSGETPERVELPTTLVMRASTAPA
ncbi:LacI family transcriptional regulator [Nonomuraea sp. MG754425]|uniref:LacI family DNA-binding transcriptional regulator n=1 Tax=Nonomuraea sp. MG754425 TaxID=2570319 RepID=UPI001F47E820|nr:LacI family DNA-binding transcriptional regulator [Nonomuraea sp. MG754425]MCF6467678.1 LacI family transcriptional regulator [Nonomuraea sp. MG754425]